MKNLKFSVIIPMYNAGKLIEPCINSLLSQTYENFEIIIIDDGSTDLSPQLVKDYSDQRITLYNLKNGGANNARNFGFTQSDGDLIFFMDQDDFIIGDNFFMKINELFCNDSALDFVIFKYMEYFQTNDFYKKRPNFSELSINSKDKYTKLFNLIKNGNVPISPWDKVFSKRFLNNSNIIFPVGLIAGDINWFIDIMQSANKFELVNESFYGYRRQVSTSLTNSFTISKFENFLHIIEIESVRILEQIESPFKELYLSFIAYEYCILMAMMSKINKKDLGLYSKRIESVKWLLKYDINVKVRQVKLLFRFTGYRIGSKLLSLYIKKVVNKN